MMNPESKKLEFPGTTLENMKSVARTIAETIQTWKSFGVVLLQGEMGAGKTTLTRLSLQYLGVKENVNSPTFAIMNEYTGEDDSLGESRYFHFDLYRLNDISELEELGFDEIWGKEGHSFIEWADRFPIDYPYPRLLVQWEPNTDPDHRTIIISSKGDNP